MAQTQLQKRKKVEKKTVYWATGKRKTSIARVRLFQGSGKIIVNSKPSNIYFGREALNLIVNQPFAATGMAEKFDVLADITGGGIASQAGALRHGISRALLLSNTELKKSLRNEGLLTRDPREKERRKVGRRKARRRPQYSKR